MDADTELESLMHEAFLDSRFLGECLRGMDPVAFERLVLKLLERQGYEIEFTPKSGDMGVDGYAYKDGNKVIVQAKRYAKTVPFQYVPQFYGVLIHQKADLGIFATTSSISSQGKEFIRDKPILVWGVNHIIKLSQELLSPTDFPGGFPIHKFSRFETRLTRKNMQCPACGSGRTVARRRRRDGKPFYGCDRWPKCDFIQDVDDGLKTSTEKQLPARETQASVGLPRHMVATKIRPPIGDARENPVSEYKKEGNGGFGWGTIMLIILAFGVIRLIAKLA